MFLINSMVFKRIRHLFRVASEDKLLSLIKLEVLYHDLTPVSKVVLANGVFLLILLLLARNFLNLKGPLIE